jgi:hypothetical protein
MADEADPLRFHDEWVAYARGQGYPECQGCGQPLYRGRWEGKKPEAVPRLCWFCEKEGQKG